MTDQTALKTATLADLNAVRQRGDLAARAQAHCASLVEKLNRPVRIGLFGLPRVGKRAVLHALSDLSLDPLAGAPPTVEVSYGASAATTAILADGSRLATTDLPTPALLAQQPVFLQVTSPAAVLMGRSVLLASTEASAEDLRAGLIWAAPRVDMALWCTVDWTEAERRIWDAAPDSLRNHAILLTTGVRDIANNLVAHGFEAQFNSAPQTGDAVYTKLTAYLDQTIQEASLHDIHAAQMFLQRYGAPPARPTPTRSAPPTEVETEATVIPHPAARTVERQVPPEAAGELARLFQAVRTAAGDLMHSVQDGSAGDADTLLARFEEVFETLADRVAGFDTLHETWPDLATQVIEAHDLALLLRIEGGAEQVGDAARLLLQVRYDIEERLAA
ncbi:hypothetical protein [Antarctobacter sp.]|uniref:hypothetical protein n=1 Tax=Antarctobacter sp. TaxID=1872577 RepID=UPI002B272D45|nr:hypothetical protein [Antarctobacter sp.]